jgi:putative ABC transport system ATP-binding protein
MIIDLQHIDKAYEADKLSVPVLKDISLQVEEGEYVAIMGPSGSGKSTLMNIIGCLDLPTAGTYTLAGESVLGKGDNALSALRNRTIGFVFQNFNLMPRETALENVALPLLYAGVRKRERMQRAREALERVGLGDRMTFKPTQLSGGQKQRVAIARAMVNNPRLLLADEPTGALDTASGEQVMELFRQLNNEGVTIVMITHEPDIAHHADRILMIRDGQFVATETHEADGTQRKTPLEHDLDALFDAGGDEG